MDFKPFKKIANVVNGNNQSRSETVYLVFLFLLILLFNTGCTTYDLTRYPSVLRIISLLRYAILGIIFVNSLFCIGDYTVRELIVSFIIAVCLMISAIKTNDNTLLFAFLVIFGSKNTDIKKSAKVYFYAYILICCIVFLLFVFDVIPDYLMDRGDGIIRHTLGFNHPNLLGRFLFTIQISYILAFPDRKNDFCFIAMSLMFAVFTWIVPNSRTSFLCMIILLIVVPALRVGIGENRLFKSMIYCIPLVLALLSIICVPIYDADNHYFSLINKFFTGRLYLAHLTYEKVGWGGFWGQNAYWTTIPLDNCYDKLIIYFGLIALIIFMTAYYYSIIKSIRNKRFDLAIALCVFSVFGVFEIHTYYIMYNLCLLAITASIANNKDTTLNVLK